MQPVPYRKLFLSRWSALIWAAGIIYMAVDTVGFAPSKPADTPSGQATVTDATGTALTPSDVSNFANITSAL